MTKRLWDPWSATRATEGLSLLERLSSAQQIMGVLWWSAPLREQHLEAVLELRGLLYGIDKHVPDVEAWCVVKTYRPFGPKPLVVTAHTSKEQAEEYASALREYYRGDTQDVYTVERKVASLGLFIAPGAGTEEYIETLEESWTTR